jgi:N-acetylated-alpha-linked acidic dipeptidase
MADADVLPYDYLAYARAIYTYLDAARRRAGDAGLDELDFTPVQAAAKRFADAARRAQRIQDAPSGDWGRIDVALRQTESAFLTEGGLPGRPWYRHTIYAPGELTGYSAEVLPGVNQAIAARDRNLAAQQLTFLTHALDRATQSLQSMP